MKKVLIATPCLYGQVDAWFVNSLYESVLLGLKNDILLQPVFLANESILPMARNELINLAYNSKYNCMVFIDSDELWDPLALIEIIQSQKVLRHLKQCQYIRKNHHKSERRRK